VIVVIDNSDSFTYNLVRWLGELGAEVSVFRNDRINTVELRALAPSHLVISPGPGAPAMAVKNSHELISQLSRSTSHMSKDGANEER
jgi:anthranilate/para-aminobenzoate synthase component II